jgi:hypothetical protein
LGLFETIGCVTKATHQSRIVGHALGCVVGFGRKTLSAILCTINQQHHDWTAHYRLYSKKRFDPEQSFQEILVSTLQLLPADQAVVSAMDDTISRKSGKKIPGVNLLRDPLSPPYRANLVRGQRLVQVSVSLSETSEGVNRMIPVLVRNAPAAKKPYQKSSQEQWEEYRKLKKERNLSKYGVDCLRQVRKNMDDCGASARMLWCSVDGGHTNKNVLRNVPPRTVIVGRIRKDAKLFYPPNQKKAKKGRTPFYGERAPTPKQLLKDETVRWKQVNIRCNGRSHTLRIKDINNLRWAASGKQEVHLIVIAPFGYRLSKRGRLNYRQPVYLICTDPRMRIVDALTIFLKRWDIEVNFRDEKTLIGAGQAQVRNPESVSALPQMAILSYAALLLAGIKAYGVGGKPSNVQPPKWYQKQHHEKIRASASDLITQMRHELWSKAITDNNLPVFAVNKHDDTKPEKCSLPLESAIFNATG